MVPFFIFTRYRLSVIVGLYPLAGYALSCLPLRKILLGTLIIGVLFIIPFLFNLDPEGMGCTFIFSLSQGFCGKC